MAEKCYCIKCKNQMGEVNFFMQRNGKRSDMCKKCETMHINNYDPETFIWLLQKYDIPFIPTEWNKIIEKTLEDKGKILPSSVFGKYLSKMKLNQYKNDRFADSERIQAEQEEKAKLYNQTEDYTKKIEGIKEAYLNGEISEAQYKTYVGVEAQPANSDYNFINNNGVVTTINGGEGVLSAPAFEKIELPDVSNELTEEDKIYLATKWGRLYAPAEWVQLEEIYQDYEKSFSLHNADLIRGTIQLCKLDLKGNQALDAGDLDGYSKIARASDSLRKSLKFTEAQRKEEKNEEFSCFGLITSFVEKNNDEFFIRPIDLSIDRDIVDRDIRNIKESNLQIIKDDPAVFKMIEQYIKKRETLAEQEKRNPDDELTDADLKQYNDFQDELKKIDEETEGQEK